MSKTCYEMMKDLGNVDLNDRCYGKEDTRRGDVDSLCKRCPHYRKNETKTVNYKVKF